MVLNSMRFFPRINKTTRQVGAPFDLPRASVRAKLGVLSGLGGSDDMVDA